MVQTRSKSRFLQHNSATVVLEGSAEGSLTVQRPERKRKRNNHTNDDDAAATENPVITTSPSLAQAITDPFICQSMDVPTTSSTPSPQEKKTEKKKCIHHSSPSPRFALPDLSIVLSLEAPSLCKI